MQSYIVTLTPLEPYFFGGERTFHYGTTKTTAPDTYYISSEKTPNQTALMGVLRYAILDKYGLLWHKGEDDKNESLRQRRKELVGENSFSIDGNNEFGMIENISPLFLRKGETTYLPAPANYGIAEGGIHFTKLHSSAPVNQVPLNYSAKDNSPPDGIYLPVCKETGKLTDPFLSDVRVGINTKEKDDAFFKKEYQMLEDGFRFAFYASLSEEIDVDGYSGTVFMGQGKSPFQIAFRREENQLKTLAEQFLPQEENEYWYALSDMWLSEEPEHKGFAILLQKKLRYLTTHLGSNTQKGRMSKTPVLYNLVQAGSVFYYNPASLKKQKNANCVGMNQTIHIEARK